MTDDPHAITVLGNLQCPPVCALLALAADVDGSFDHLDACPRCRDLVLASRERARELGPAGEDLSCDDVEALQAHADDGGELGRDDRARLLIHYASCESCRACAEPPPSDLPAPVTPAGVQLPIVARTSYALGREVARGGMGRILEAIDRRLGRPVAIKEVLPSGDRPFAEADHFGTRLEREARITARLNHPSIVSVHEAGRWPTGTPFFAMDLVAGRSLDRVIAAAATLEDRLALLPHVIRVADALAYAHNEGVIHRDLKPANVLVGSFGETVVIDWGLAKDLRGPGDEPPPPGVVGQSGSGENLTEAGAMVGTPAYMSPEQAEGEPAGRGSDVYAIGAMLYHLLAGKPPYTEPSSFAVLHAVREGPPAAIQRVEPKVPEALATIVTTAMARQAADRYPSAGELAGDLRRFETGQLVLAHRYGLVDLIRHWLEHRRVSVTLAVVLAAILLMTGGLGLHGVLRERDRASAAADRAERFSERLVIERARAQILRDPTAAIAWLRRLALTERTADDAQTVAAEALNEGVARHVLAGHTGIVAWGAVSADGRQLVTGTTSGELRLWDLQRGTVRPLGRHGGAIHELAFNSDGSRVAVAGASGLELWETRTGAHRSIPGHAGPVYTVAFADDDRALVSGGEDGTARRFEIDAGAGRVLAGTPDASAGERGPIVPSTRIARDAPRVYTFQSQRPDVTVVCAGAGKIAALDAAGRTLWEHEHPGGMPATFAIRDGELATAGQDGIVRRWRVDSGAVTTLAQAKDVVVLAYSPDGRWLAGVARASTLVRVWDLHDGAERALEGHALDPHRLAWSRDGALLASAGLDATVRVWDPLQGEQWSLRGHRGAVKWLAFGAGDVLFSHSVEGLARLWHPTPRAARVLRGHQGPVLRGRFAGAAAVLATGGDHTVRVWDPATATATVLAHPVAPGSFELSEDGHWLGSDDELGTCRLWDVRAATAREIGERGACAGRGGVKFDRSGRFVATLSSQGVLAVRGTEDLALATPPRASVAAMQWSETSLMLIDHEGNVARLAPPSWVEERVARAPAKPGVLWSTDGGTLAIQDEGAYVLVGLHGGGEWTRVPVPDAPVSKISISPDGRRFVIGDQRGRLHVVDTRTGATRVLAAHTAGVVSLRVSRHGDRVASASNNELLLWDLETGRYQRLHGEAYKVNDLDFAPDDKQLSAVGADGTVRLWPLAPPARAPASVQAVERTLVEATSAVLDDRDVLGSPRP